MASRHARIAWATLIVADRPYLLLIEDTASHAPLFLARIADPAAHS
jgi:serine protease inhibitor